MKSISLIILALVKGIFLEESENGLEHQQHDDSPLKLEDKLLNNSRELATMELQIQQIQKSLEDIETVINTTHKDYLQTGYSIARNCQEIKKRGGTGSQTYLIKPKLSFEPFVVRCNLDIRGGGWTYVLNRFDGSQDFDLTWYRYKKGFGNLDQEFWLGLENLYQLTAFEINELLIELVDRYEKKVHAHYTGFSIGNETEGYPIKVLEGYSGDAGDSLSKSYGMKFSTRDNDQDIWLGHSADRAAGGWWYSWFSSIYGTLTGKYSQTKFSFDQEIYWPTFHTSTYDSIKEVRMMVKPRSI